MGKLSSNPSCTMRFKTPPRCTRILDCVAADSMLIHPPTARTLLLCPQKYFCFRSYTTTSSVNASEISHFDALASTWWDLHGSLRLLHLMNPLRHDFISACRGSHAVPNPPAKNSLRYLDIGCGGGIFSESAARLTTTKSVTAIDPSREVISIATAHARQDPIFQEPGRLEYLNVSIENLPIPKNSEMQYDVVTLFEVIEHVDFPAAFLSYVLPFVKPGGWIILSTIARTWSSWLTTKFLAEDVMRLVPRGTHEWKKYINPEELRDFFRSKNGWGGEDDMRTQGVVYLPGIGWRNVTGGGRLGNYFFGVRNQNGGFMAKHTRAVT